jgi:serine/threonine protein kinase
MAPELIKGTDYDTKVDIWSLGALVVEMAQNNPPYIEYPSLRVSLYRKIVKKALTYLYLSRLFI